MNGKLVLTVEDEEEALAAVSKLASNNGIEIKSIGIHKPTLEDVFIHYTGRRIREEKWDRLALMKSRVASIRRRS